MQYCGKWTISAFLILKEILPEAKSLQPQQKRACQTTPTITFVCRCVPALWSLLKSVHAHSRTGSQVRGPSEPSLRDTIGGLELQTLGASFNAVISSEAILGELGMLKEIVEQILLRYLGGLGRLKKIVEQILRRYLGELGILKQIVEQILRRILSKLCTITKILEQILSIYGMRMKS